jgi:hypothetical protein
VNLQPSTDITVLAGRRIRINGRQVAQVQAIRHGREATHQVDALAGGVWGDCFYEPHGDDRGGNSAFWWPYGTDVEVTA